MPTVTTVQVVRIQGDKPANDQVIDICRDSDGFVTIRMFDGRDEVVTRMGVDIAITVSQGILDAVRNVITKR